MWKRLAVTAALVLSALTGSTPAAAETPRADVKEKRALQDYDGRGGRDRARLELIAPRILLFPPWFLHEFLLRRPLGSIVKYVEKESLIQEVKDVFTFGPNNTMGLVPSALFDFGLLPSVGLYYFWDKAVVERNAVRAHFGTWGVDWINATLSDRFRLDKDGKELITVRGEYTRRNDLVFAGLGPDSQERNRSRYSIERGDLRVAYDNTNIWRGSSFSSAVGIRAVGFREGTLTCCNNPSIRERIAAGDFLPPDGFDRPYTVVYQTMQAVLDTRQPRPAPGTGVRVTAEAQPAFQVTPSGAAKGWVRWGGEVGGSLDLNGRQRVLSLSAAAWFVDSLDGSTIPFTEQVILGGLGHMRGFLLNRLVGRSAGVATLKYDWPIWAFLDGTMHVAMGNVFDERLRGLSLEKMRISSGIGLRTNSSRDHSVEALVGFGTDTFEQGGNISSVRIVVGGNRGF